MRWTIERLRLAIIVVAAVLVLSILGSIVYGRWRIRRAVQDLPSRLGIQIQSTSRDFVLSKTDEGRKLFTLHAARAISFKAGGKVSLHNVEIDVYNRQNDQADTITGKDFEYDKDSQLVIARSEAQITLHPPPRAHSTSATDAEAQFIHVTTHGLVFNQKTGEATCNGEVDFQYSKSTGKSLGAQYFSKAGQLILESQVVLTTQMQNRSVVIHASHATYDRQSSQVHLAQPRYLSTGSRGDQHGSAGAATVYLRPDGSAERMDAQGSVEIASAAGTGVRSSSMRVDLDEDNQPQQAHFFGGVELAQNEPTQQTVGTGRDAVVDFDGNGHAKLVTLDGDVIFRQQIEADKNDLHRTLSASHLVLHLKPAQLHQKSAKGQGSQTQLQEAEGSGGAVFTSQNMVEGHPAQETSLAAQNMKATFAPGNEMRHLDGVGQTRIRMVAPNGDIDTSTGDVLAIDFVTGVPKADAARQGGLKPTNAKSIRTAVDGSCPHRAPRRHHHLRPPRSSRARRNRHRVPPNRQCWPHLAPSQTTEHCRLVDHRHPYRPRRHRRHVDQRLGRRTLRVRIQHRRHLPHRAHRACRTSTRLRRLQQQLQHRPQPISARTKDRARRRRGFHYFARGWRPRNDHPRRRKY